MQESISLLTFWENGREGKCEVPMGEGDWGEGSTQKALTEVPPIKPWHVHFCISSAFRFSSISLSSLLGCEKENCSGAMLFLS